MKLTGAKISEQIARGRVALRDNTRALTSLLLLGLTRGCRVLWGAPGGRKARWPSLLATYPKIDSSPAKGPHLSSPSRIRSA